MPEHILMIEDDESLAAMVGEYLGGFGMAVSTRSTATEGAQLRVADRGPGIPEEERERIFEPFYRPAHMREQHDTGVGLGLALVRQIARHHGGEARCLPRDGGGLCFEVDLRRGLQAEAD